MGIDSILERILNEGKRQQDAIISEAVAQAEKIGVEGQQTAREASRKILGEEVARIAMNRQRRLTAVRLENRKDVLRVKQEIMARLFTELKPALKKKRLKKRQVSIAQVKDVGEDVDFFLARLRQDVETEIAAILFS